MACLEIQEEVHSANMESLRRYNFPKDLESPVLLFAFAGWSDAAESASHAAKFLIRQMRAERFADIDAEEFYDFTQVRPKTRFDKSGDRYIKWPANEFYVHRTSNGQPDLVLFLGIEPNLKWKTFADLMKRVIIDSGVRQVVHLGALLDAVPHTREVRLTGSATSNRFQIGMPGTDIKPSRYAGPTGITGVLMDAIRREGIQAVSLWGHSPHYLQVSPNPKVSLALVSTVAKLLGFQIDCRPLESQGINFDARVEQALSDEPDVLEYVEKLQEEWDQELEQASQFDDMDLGIPNAEQAVLGIEEFLGLAKRPSKGESGTD